MGNASELPTLQQEAEALRKAHSALTENQALLILMALQIDWFSCQDFDASMDVFRRTLRNLTETLGCCVIREFGGETVKTAAKQITMRSEMIQLLCDTSPTRQ